MFERMLVGSIENRITVGILSFLGIMVILGWAAINEGGRMQAFQEMEEARSVELGAELFAANCSTCHGNEGFGIGGRAPGLNNPQFFDHDFFPEISTEVSALRIERGNLSAEKESLATENNRPDTTDARKTEIADRTTAIDTRVTEIDARLTELETQYQTAVQPAIDKGYSADPARFSRLSNLGWVGTHESFVQTTLIHGRPTSISYWPQAMVAWSQIAGGPLRMDQIEDLVSYIQNWDKGEAWTLDDLFAVQQFAIEPGIGGAASDAEPGVGTAVLDIVSQLASVTPDPARGDQLYHGGARSSRGVALGCSGCHLQDANGVGPMTAGTYTRAEGERLAALPGYTVEQYLVEAIVNPGAYVVPGFNNVMVGTFGDSLTLQDLADIVAYLETQNQ